MSQLRITGLTLAPGAAVITVIYIVLGAAGLAKLPPEPPRDASDVALLGWVVLMVVVLGVYLWHYGVRHVGVVVASLYMNLVPVVAVAITAALGTPPTWNQVVGCWSCWAWPTSSCGRGKEINELRDMSATYSTIFQ